MPLFQHDHFLAFLHPYLLAFLSTSKWAQNLETFQSPLDPRWNDFLHQLTPSFMLMSLENPPVNVSPDPNVERTSAEPKMDFDFSRRFISIGTSEKLIYLKTISIYPSFFSLSSNK